MPKESFNLYHSATQHIVHKPRLPRAVYFFALSILFTVAIGAYAFDRIVSKGTINTDFIQAETSMPETPATLAKLEPPPNPPPQQVIKIEPAQKTFNSIQILTESIDWTLVKACMKSKEKCVCYGQSSERLLIDKTSCEMAIDYGWPGKKV